MKEPLPADAVMGCRPSDIDLFRDPDAGMVTGTVTRVNLLGPIVDQRIDFAGHELRSQMETHYAIDHNLIFEEGDRVGIHIANQLIFDARTMEGVIEDA